MKKNKRDTILGWIISILILALIVAILLLVDWVSVKWKRWLWFGGDSMVVYAAEEKSTGLRVGITIPNDILERVEEAELERSRATDFMDACPPLKDEPPLHSPVTGDVLYEEKKLGEMELLSQLIQAEAGNQDLIGMRLVADVILNRVDSPRFPNNIPEVIFQMNPRQFTVTGNGMFEEAAWKMSENAFKAVELEMKDRLDYGILYFSTYKANGTGFWKYGDHWFSY